MVHAQASVRLAGYLESPPLAIQRQNKSQTLTTKQNREQTSAQRSIWNTCQTHHYTQVHSTSPELITKRASILSLRLQAHRVPRVWSHHQRARASLSAVIPTSSLAENSRKKKRKVKVFQLDRREQPSALWSSVIIISAHSSQMTATGDVIDGAQI